MAGRQIDNKPLGLAVRESLAMCGDQLQIFLGAKLGVLIYCLVRLAREGQKIGAQQSFNIGVYDLSLLFAR